MAQGERNYFGQHDIKGSCTTSNLQACASLGMSSQDRILARVSPSSPLSPQSLFHGMKPDLNRPVAQSLSIVCPDDEAAHPMTPPPSSGEHTVEANLGRKRRITFACGAQPVLKTQGEQQPKLLSAPQPATEPAKRACTIKFVCPTKVSTDAPSMRQKPRNTRRGSPAPLTRMCPSSNTLPKPHRDSDATVRNQSPVTLSKKPLSDRSRRLSANSDLARCEAFRFHEFASCEDDVQEWTQESTCHRQPLTIRDTLKLENNLRKLGEEAEEEAIDEDEENDEDMVAEGDDDDELELDEDDEDDEEQDNSDAHNIFSDEGFRTDDEEGFAGSDDESNEGSDFNWWAPGRSTAATSMDRLEHIRSTGRRSVSESSTGSIRSEPRYKPEKAAKRGRSRPVNIRIPSPELPDSTDFVCGTLDEDRPLEEAYLSALELRRAAKHKMTPQDVDPTFPTSDPDMDEEEDSDELDNPISESDQHCLIHGQMDTIEPELRGRHKTSLHKRSPLPSPKRLRSPRPTNYTTHRSPPPKVFGQSPRRLRSPPAPIRLRSPPPTRRASTHVHFSKRTGLSVQFGGLVGRPLLTTSFSLPRNPSSALPPDYEDDDDTPNEFPVRRAIDIKVGLEKKRQRRREQHYKKLHRKGTKEKRPLPGKGCERMREVGLGLAAHKGKATGFALFAPPMPEQKNMHVLSV